MKRRFAILLLGGLLAGCATAPLPPASREALRDFSLDARFALRTTPSGQQAQSNSGRLTWSHRQNRDRILLASPLGYGVAEIDVTPQQATLRSANGDTRVSTDPDTLIEEATGYRLPVSRLPGWLLGRPTHDATLIRDPAGRPRLLREEGWQVEYAYDDDAADALPARLAITHEVDVELKLRIEEWRDQP